MPTPIPTEPRNALALSPGEAQLTQVVETSAAAAVQMARTNIEARFQVALYRPRNWDTVRKAILDTCTRPRFAEEGKYSVPRGRDTVEGLSIRFAEEVVRSMGNLMIEANVKFDDEERRIIQVVATDLQANVTWPFDVVVEKVIVRKRSQQGLELLETRKNAKNELLYVYRATEDDVFTRQNALVAKAARNGILRFLPADVQEEALTAINETLTKTARNKDTLKRLLEAYTKLGVGQDHLEGYLNHKIEQITADEYSRLRGIGHAIQDGETTWADVIKGTPAESKFKTEPTLKANPLEGKTQPKAETIDMADKPKPAGPLPDSSYGREIDQGPVADPDAPSLRFAQPVAATTASAAPAAPQAAEVPVAASPVAYGPHGEDGYPQIEIADGTFRPMTDAEKQEFEAAMESNV